MKLQLNNQVGLLTLENMSGSLTRSKDLGKGFGHAFHAFSSPLLLRSRSSIPLVSIRTITNSTTSSRKGRKGLEFDSKSFKSLIEKELQRFNGMILRKEGRRLIGYLKDRLLGVGGRCSRSRCALLVVFVRLCLRIFSNEGMKGLVLYLKTSYVLIQQAIAGYIIEDQAPLKRRVRRARSGLPYGIPTQQRTLMIKGDIPTIRFGSSLVSIYRVLHFPSRVSVESIISPGTEDGRKTVDLLLFEKAVGRFGEKVGLAPAIERVKNFDFELFPIGKSSPLTPFRGDFIDTVTLLIGGKGTKRAAISTAKNLIHASAHMLFNIHTDILDYMQVFASNCKGFFEFFARLRRASITLIDPDLYQKKFLVGALGLKDEPAGKVRVFAMVDCGTQGLLRPLHLLLQDLVRPLDEDATFDQIGKLEAKMRLMQSKYRRPKAFSFDLSSATDRLPIGIQVSILTPLLGIYESKAGAALLTFRDYSLPLRARLDTMLDSVRYAVGQPMGALSSGMMLAITHHVIVQGAALRARKFSPRWFAEYVVLGDDIVIFDPKVANEYYFIMTTILGVKIGLAKSIKSKRRFVLEFAKKLGVDGDRAFVVPIRDTIVACLSTEAMIEYTKKYSQPYQDYLKMRGLGFKTRGKWMSNFWKMPDRLRIYIIYKAFYQLEFMEGVTMKSLMTNFLITRQGIEKFVLELYSIRREKISSLERMKTLTLEEIAFYQRSPLYIGTHLHDDLKKVVDFGLTINSFRLLPEFDPQFLDVDKLRILIGEILESIDKIDELRQSHPSLTLITQVRPDPKPFGELVSVYKVGCRLNNCFSGTQDGATPETLLTDEAKAYQNYLSEEPSIWVSSYVTSDFFSAYHHKVSFWDFMTVRYGMEFFGGFLLAGILLFSQEKEAVLASPYLESYDSSLEPQIIWSLFGKWFFVFCLAGFLLGLGYWFIPEPDLGIIADRTRELLEHERVDAAIRRASVSQTEVPITRSPQIGHGGSEPGSFNPDGPDNGR